MYKCGAYNPVTREVKVEPYGTKLLVKSKLGKNALLQRHFVENTNTVVLMCLDCI